MAPKANVNVEKVCTKYLKGVVTVVKCVKCQQTYHPSCILKIRGTLKYSQLILKQKKMIITELNNKIGILKNHVICRGCHLSRTEGKKTNKIKT